MVTPFLTLRQISTLFSKPSAVLMRDAVASPATVEQFMLSDEEEQGRAIAIIAQENPGVFKNVA